MEKSIETHERVRALFNARGLPLKTFSDILNIDRAMATRFFKGKRGLRYDEAEKIAEHIGAKITDIYPNRLRAETGAFRLGPASNHDIAAMTIGALEKIYGDEPLPMYKLRTLLERVKDSKLTEQDKIEGFLLALVKDK